MTGPADPNRLTPAQALDMVLDAATILYRKHSHPRGLDRALYIVKAIYGEELADPGPPTHAALFADDRQVTGRYPVENGQASIAVNPTGKATHVGLWAGPRGPLLFPLRNGREEWSAPGTYDVTGLYAMPPRGRGPAPV